MMVYEITLASLTASNDKDYSLYSICQGKQFNLARLRNSGMWPI